MTERAGHAYDTLSSLSDIELKAFDGVVVVVGQSNSNSVHWTFYHLIFSQIYRASFIMMMPSHHEQFIVCRRNRISGIVHCIAEPRERII